MYGFEIIKELAAALSGDEIIISSNGNISRQVYHYLQRPQIYLRGSMGLAIPVGLGVALARPEKKILIVVGDGNLLMGLGSLVTSSFASPKNMRILILDNNMYATTGRQKTTSCMLNYSSVLDGFGIPALEPIQPHDPIEDIRKKLNILMNASGLCVLPTLVDVKPPALSNIPWHPDQIAAFQRNPKK